MEFSDVKRNKKLNNDGFSLVELLIAVTILSIIVAPMLHSLVTSLNTNAKARRLMHATQIAEDVMEEFEAHSIQEMMDIYSAAPYNYTVTEDNSVSNKGKVTFTGSNASVASGRYDIEVVLDSTKTEYAPINNMEIADIENLSGGVNALYMDSLQEINSAYVYFGNYSLGTYSESTIRANTTRNIDIIIGKTPLTVDLGAAGTTTVDVYTVTAEIQYECPAMYLQDYAPTKYPQNAKEYIIFSNAADVNEQAKAIKNGTSTETEVISSLANIVLCIEPRVDGGADYIKVKNPQNVDTNIFLVMQGDDSKINNAGCKVHYDLYEANGSWMPSAGSSVTANCTLRTNLLNNQGTYYGYHNLDNGNGMSGQAYRDSATGSYTIGADNGGSGVDALNILKADELTPTDKYNRIYEITVKVYADGTMGTSAPIIAMTGTVTDDIKAD